MISRSASYAVRALTYLATVRSDEWVLNREIASELSLPPQFLTKILRTLAGSGILLSRRGKAGGFRLAHAANEITLLEVVDPFDHISDRRPCLLGQLMCSDETACPVHEEWKESQATLLRILSTKTIADISSGTGAIGFPRPHPATTRIRSPRRPAASRPGVTRA